MVRPRENRFRKRTGAPKLKSLLAIAGNLKRDGKLVNADDVERARREGASDVEIHDTVLIVASFWMYNRDNAHQLLSGIGGNPPLAPRRDRAGSRSMHQPIALRLHRRIE